MSKILKLAFFLLILFGIAAIGLLIYHSGNIAVLSPQGMIGDRQSELLLISTYLMLIVVIPVFLLAFFVTWRYRASRKAEHAPDWDHSHLAEAIWWGVPLIIIVVLGYLTWRGCHELDPFKPIASDVKPVRIQVVALEWKWLFIYPEEKIAAVNFVQFPEKTPINFEITSDAPMNSFWIPELGGQIYAMSGMRSKLHLMANGVGKYRGASANISGDGFSGMTFTAQSSSQEDYDAWVASMQQSPDVLDYGVYSQLLKPTEYVPPSFYRLGEDGLFDWVIMKYMMPMKQGADHAK